MEIITIIERKKMVRNINKINLKGGQSISKIKVIMG